MMRQAGWWLGLGAAAVAMGFLAQAAGLPGGWLLGPMAAAIVAGLRRPEHGAMPAWVPKVAQAVIGILIAGVFEPSVLPLVAKNWLAVLMVVGTTLGLSLAAGVLLARVTPLDRRTAAFGTLPGGASSMIAMSLNGGADTRMVALMQYIRLAMSVGAASLLARFVLHPAVPHAASASVLTAHRPWPVYLASAALAAAGGWLGPRLKIPAGGLLGPLLLGVAASALHAVKPGWPPGVAPAAYVLMGLYVGLRFDRDALREAGRLLPVLFVNTLVLMAVCASLGAALAALTHTDYLTGYLATTPGGLDTIAVVALGGGANISLVLAVQMMRVLAIVLLGPLLARRFLTGAAEAPLYIPQKETAQ